MEHCDHCQESTGVLVSWWGTDLITYPLCALPACVYPHINCPVKSVLDVGA